jgi:sugar/nucleoside kinase (ribokinase family)
MKILGIGNAIVDVLCKVDDEFLIKNNLVKSTMKLLDEEEFKKLIQKLKIEETISGGSVANSIVGLSQLGNEVGFIGKVNQDNLGDKYDYGLRKEKVNYLYIKKQETIPTGTCLILITPDSERTMCTFLGIAGKINEKDIDERLVKKSEITFLEGYLWDKGDPKKAFEKAINNSNKVAMSLSDLFCVERHKKEFLELVKNRLDIVFANEQEILSLIDGSSIEDAINFSREIDKNIIITRGADGAIAVKNKEIFQCNAKNNLNLVDLTGAGDLFAAGYLHGIINNLSIEEALNYGTDLSSKVIQQIGARIRNN